MVVALQSSHDESMHPELFCTLRPLLKQFVATLRSTSADYGTTVVVKNGDSLWNIAHDKYGNGLFHTFLKEANWEELRATSGVLRPGQTLRVPPAYELLTKQHIVRGGESLWKIAKREWGDGAKGMEIYKNGPDRFVDPDLIYPLQELPVSREQAAAP